MKSNVNVGFSRKIVLAILLAALFSMALFALYTMSAKKYVYAASSGTVIDLSDTTTASGTGWTYTDGVFRITENGNYLITGSTSTSKIVLDPSSAGASLIASLTLQNANITLSGDGGSPISCENMTSTKSVEMTLNLEGNNVCMTTTAQAEGIKVSRYTHLIINGTGSLTAEGGQNAAGIGGGTSASNDTCGQITINGGNVTATSGSSAAAFSASGAGIGGSGGAKLSASAPITINGGKVVATAKYIIVSGASYGAAEGIGDGYLYPSTTQAAGSVRINGGNVINRIYYPENPPSAAYYYIAGISRAQNAVGTSVYLNELTMGSPAVTDAVVTNITVSAVGNSDYYSYGLTDVSTDEEGKIYVYLPNSGNSGTDLEEISVTVGGITYQSSYARPTPTLQAVNPRYKLVRTLYSSQTLDLTIYRSASAQPNMSLAPTDENGNYIYNFNNSTYYSSSGGIFTARVNAYTLGVSGLTSVIRPNMIYLLNNGNVQTGNLTATLTGTNADCFSIYEPSDVNNRANPLSMVAMDSLNPYDEAFWFYLWPNEGLGVGTYTATLEITSTGGIDVSIALSFKVTGTAGNISMSTAPVTQAYSPDFSFRRTASSSNSPGTITYAKTSGTAVADVNPNTGEVTNVTALGSMVITATLAPSGDYEGAQMAYTLNITQASLTITWSGSPPYVYTHTGLVQHPTATINENLSTNDGLVTLIYSGGSANLGNHTVTASLSGEKAAFYILTNNSDELSLEFEITKAGQAAPAAPMVESKTATSITLAEIPGAEYRLSTGTWQSSPLFTGLLPATGYIFYARLAEDGNYNASPESPASAMITTDAATLGGTVTVTGTLQFGQTLTANTDGLSSTPSVTLGALTYQWKRGTVNIGTNSSTYVLTQDDIGQTITVTVTAANCDGSVISGATAAVSKASQAAPEAPHSLAVDATTIMVIIPTYNPNLFEFRIDGGEWQDNGGEFYELTPNTEYKFEARYKETTTHAASAASELSYYSTDKPALSGSVAISGTAAYGQTLTVNTSGLTSSPAGYAVGTITYQWKRNGTDIVGATDSAYTLVQEDIGQNISVVATAANCSGFVTSSPTTAVTKSNQSAPSLDYSVSDSSFPKTITITPVSGAEYRFNNGEWSSVNTYTSIGAETVTLSIRSAETDTHFASSASSMQIDTANQNQQAPAAFTLTYTANGDTDYTVTIPKVDGAEYSFDGETWSDENIKTNCIPGSTITGYMRMAVKPGYNASGATLATITLPLFQVAAPSATPNGGTFIGSVNVTLSTATSGAVIYYTLDGTTPDAGSARYDGAFTLTVSATVKAVAIKEGMIDSSVLTLAFEIQELSYIVAVENGTGGGSYVSGALVTVTANAAADGKEFDKWMTDDGVTFADASLSQTTFIMPDKDVTVTALYKDIPAASRTVTSGDNGTWNKDSDNGFTITVSGDFDAGITVKVDGNVLTNNEYTVAAGSTKVTIKKSYLDTLAKGEHTVEVLFTDGASISTTLTIGASNPKGISGGAIAGIAIGSTVTLAIIGFAIYWFAIKKKTFAALFKKQ